MGTFGLMFPLYARLVLPIVFLLQAFTTVKLFDSNMEQGNGLCLLRQSVLQ